MLRLFHVLHGERDIILTGKWSMTIKKHLVEYKRIHRNEPFETTITWYKITPFRILKGNQRKKNKNKATPNTTVMHDFPLFWISKSWSSVAPQHGGFCIMWPLAAKVPLFFLTSYRIIPLTAATSGILQTKACIVGTNPVEHLDNTSCHLKLRRRYWNT